MNTTDVPKSSRIREIVCIYSALGYQVISVSAHVSDNLEELKQLAARRHLAFLGQSGVGKLSLINAFIGG